MSQYLIEVAVPVLLRRSFYYLTDAPLPALGCRVVVPFGARKLMAVVIGHPDSAGELENKLKPIERVVDEQPCLPNDILELMKWSANYYHHPIGEVFQNALPIALRKIVDEPLSQPNAWQVTQQGSQTDLAELARAPKQKAALSLFQQHHCIVKQGLTGLGIHASIVKALANKGLITEVINTTDEQQQELAKIGPNPWTTNSANRHRLTREQAVALAALNQLQQQFHVALLEGVTGSGKTEVYLQAIEAHISEGRQILVLVPEIGLTPQTLARFEKRFVAPVAMLHSGMTDKQRLSVWQGANKGELAIVIGTRSAIFTPFKHLGLIIVDEEHDASLKQHEGFRYHARDLAVKRAADLAIPLILGSATPSLETLNHAKQGRYHHLILSQKAVADNPVRHGLIDGRTQVLVHGISKAMLEAMATTLKKGEQVMIFLNRRGFAPSLICQECGWVSECLRCQKPYTFHQHSRRQICHHCCDERAVIRQCHHCGSSKINTLGLGTEKLEQLFNEQFPSYSTVRIDRDTTQRRGELAKLLSAIHDQQHQIIVGTQMLAKGHHFANVTLVGIVDVDSALFSFDFRAPEKLAQLLLQVAGRAGREHKPGTVLLQTYHPQHPLLANLLQHGYQHWALEELAMRQALALPPFAYQAVIRAQALIADLPLQFLQTLRDAIEPISALEILGPTAAVMEKKAGKFRFIMLLQSPDRRALHTALRHISQLGPTLSQANKINWIIDVDPQEVC